MCTSAKLILLMQATVDLVQSQSVTAAAWRASQRIALEKYNALYLRVETASTPCPNGWSPITSAEECESYALVTNGNKWWGPWSNHAFSSGSFGVGKPRYCSQWGDNTKPGAWGRVHFNKHAAATLTTGGTEDRNICKKDRPATSPSAPPPAAPKTGASGDPHIIDPHGGRYDFKGEDDALYCFHSSRNLSLNVRTELADFELHEADHPRHKHVHGSFLTQAHVVARTYTDKILHVSFYADVIGETNMALVNGTIDGAPFKLGAHREKTVDDVALKNDYSTLQVLTPEFEIKVTPIFLGKDYLGRGPPELNVIGVHHRLDVQLKLRVAEDELAVAPHGIIGQGWDGDGLAIDGEQDIFPESGEFTTYAMGKGAIEGVADDYKVYAPYATDFKFSRFDKTEAVPRDVAKLVSHGVLNVPKKTATTGDGFVGSTERNPTEL